MAWDASIANGAGATEPNVVQLSKAFAGRETAVRDGAGASDGDIRRRIVVPQLQARIERRSDTLSQLTSANILHH